jgi:hypothetical protein
MTIEMNEFDQLKKKFYEQFAKEYNIQLREADMQAPAADPNMAVNQTPAPAPIQPASTDPVPPIQVAQDIAPGVAADTSLQVLPLDDSGINEITFAKGNLNTIQASLKAVIKKPGLILRTILPLIEKALIELLGNSSSYVRDSFTYATTVVNNQIVYDVTTVYSVSLFIGTDIEKSAVAHDQKYIMDTIAVVPGLIIKNVNIDTKTGLVTVSVEI